MRVTFVPPFIPTVNCWFDNLADNLGGSNTNTGPLNFVSTTQTASINIRPTTIVKYQVGQPGAISCVPTFFGYECTMVIITKFQVHANAIIGTVIGVPTRATPCSNANIDANKMMIDLGPDVYLNILSDDPGKGFSRTLTIVE